jgi:hypothetical protein
MTQLARTLDAVSRSWTARHQVLLCGIFIGCCAAGIAVDLFLVLVLHVKSISLSTWIAENAHPTLIGAGVLAGVGICYLVRSEWRLVMFAGILTGHLFLHM